MLKGVVASQTDLSTESRCLCACVPCISIIRSHSETVPLELNIPLRATRCLTISHALERKALEKKEKSLSWQFHVCVLNDRFFSKALGLEGRGSKIHATAFFVSI